MGKKNLQIVTRFMKSRKQLTWCNLTTTTPGFTAHLSYKIIRQNHRLREIWCCNVENSSILMTHDKCGWQLGRIRYSHVNIYTPPRRRFLSTPRFATYICCWAQARARRWFGSVILVLYLWVAPSSSPLVFVFFSSRIYVHHLHNIGKLDVSSQDRNTAKGME
jgi:hypothetical protein